MTPGRAAEAVPTPSVEITAVCPDDHFGDRPGIGDLALHEPQVGVGERKPCGVADKCRDGESASECLPDDFTAGLARRAKHHQIHPVARAPAGTVTVAAAIASTATTTART